jgi:hypothetical protein
MASIPSGGIIGIVAGCTIIVIFSAVALVVLHLKGRKGVVMNGENAFYEKKKRRSWLSWLRPRRVKNGVFLLII